MDLNVEEDRKTAMCKLAVVEWHEDHPDLAMELGFTVLAITGSSIKVKIQSMVFEILTPSSVFGMEAMTEEVFVILNPDGSAPEGLVVALNEKVQRVQAKEGAIATVLDFFCNALSIFLSKRELKENVNSQNSSMPYSSAFLTQGFGDSTSQNERGLEGDADSDQSDDDAEFDEFCDDHEDKQLQRAINRRYTTLMESSVRDGSKEVFPINLPLGYLHTVTTEARNLCDGARYGRMNTSFSETPIATIDNSNIVSPMEVDDILQFCTISTEPTLCEVRIEAEVIGVVSDLKVAKGLGFPIHQTVHICLEFDHPFWNEEHPTKPLKVNRAKISFGASPSVEEISKIDGSWTVLSEEASDDKYEAKQITDFSTGKAEAYGGTVLIPELIQIFFHARNKNTAKEPLSKLSWTWWENRSLDEALQMCAQMDNPFIGLICFVIIQLRAFPGWCTNCWNLLPASERVLRLRTCQKELCLYSFEELGIGATIHQEILESPEVAMLELSLACAAASDGSRDIFEPFPANFWNGRGIRGRSGCLSRSPESPLSAFSINLKQLPLLLETLQSIPSTNDLITCADESSLKRKLSSVAFKFWKEKGPTIRTENCDMYLSYYLMRFILSTNRGSLRLLKEHEELNLGVRSTLQFVILHDSPEKEAEFQQRKAECSRGSFFAFHGSALSNWYSILRNGLRIMSRTPLMGNGAFFGDGLYLAETFQYSYKFSAMHHPRHPRDSWKNGALNPGSRVVGICETVNSVPANFGNGVYLIPNEADVVVRYLLVLTDNPSKSDLANSAKIVGSLFQSNGEQIQKEMVNLQEHYTALRDGERAKRREIIQSHRKNFLMRARHAEDPHEGHRTDIGASSGTTAISSVAVTPDREPRWWRPRCLFNFSVHP